MRFIAISCMLVIVMSGLVFGARTIQETQDATIQENIIPIITGDERVNLKSVKVEYNENTSQYSVLIEKNMLAPSRNLEVRTGGVRQGDLQIKNGRFYELELPKEELLRTKIGRNSIVFKQENSVFFNFTEENLGLQNITLTVEGEPTSFLNVSYNPVTYKTFGTGNFSGLKNATWNLSSTLPLTEVSPFIYEVSKIENGRKISQEYSFIEDCTKIYEEQNTSSNCDFNLYNTQKTVTGIDITNDEEINQTITTYHLEVRFISNKTFDPTVTINDVATYPSINNNITFEPLPNSHLTTTDADLILYHGFDQPNSTTSYDLTDHDHDGTLTLATINENGGVYGGSLEGSTSNTYVTLSDIDELDGTAHLSVCAWHKTTNDDGEGIVVKGPLNTNNRNFLLYKTAGGDVPVFYIATASTTWVNSGGGSTAINDDVWRHLCGTYDGVAGNITIYVNGALENSNGAGVPATTQSTSEPVRFGLWYDSTSSFEGSLDEIMIFNRTLNATEISDIYNNQSSRFYSEGFQTFQVTNIEQNGSLNKINITTNTTQLSDANINLRIREWNGTTYNDSIDGTIDEDIVLWLHFDNNSNQGENDALIYDWSGNGNNGSVSGAVYDASGYYTGGFNFDGIDDGITINSNSLFDANDFTISMWIKSNGSWDSDGGSGGGGQGSAMIVGRHDATNSDNGYYLLQTTVGAVIFGAKAGSSAVISLNSGSAYTDNEWHHVVMVVNRSNGATNYIYGDGALLNSATNSAAWSFNNQEMVLGDSDDTWWEEWNGTIDELIMWNRSLSAEDVEELYTKGKLKYDTPSNWQEVTTGDDVNTVFDMATTTTHVLTEFNLTSSSNNFLTPYLKDSIIIESSLVGGGGGDTCTYAGAGDWVVDGSDNCLISTPYDMGGNNVYVVNDGSLTFISGSFPYNFNEFGISPATMGGLEVYQLS